MIAAGVCAEFVGCGFWYVVGLVGFGFWFVGGFGCGLPGVCSFVYLRFALWCLRVWLVVWVVVGVDCGFCGLVGGDWWVVVIWCCFVWC